MIFFIGLIFGRAGFAICGYLQTASGANSYFHTICLSRTPPNLKFHDFLNSIVCGNSLTSPILKQLLTDSSLIHLVVVSGSHFILLIWILQKIRCPKILQLCCLGIYWLMTEAQAPGLFALLIWTLRQGPTITLKGHQKVLLTGLGCLLIQPQSINSASLYLSWLCGLALSIRRPSSWKNPGFQELIIYFTINIFGGWAVWSHPLGLVFNLTVGTFMSLVLFPTGLFIMTFQSGTVVFDRLTEALIWVLQQFGPNSEIRPWIWNPSWWFFIFLIHALLQFIEQEVSQRQIQRYENQ